MWRLLIYFGAGLVVFACLLYMGNSDSSVVGVDSVGGADAVDVAGSRGGTDGGGSRGGSVARPAVDLVVDEGGALPDGASGGGHDPAAHIIRQWQGVLSPGVEGWVAAYSDHGEDRISLPTFDGDRLAVRIQRVGSSAAVGGATLRGTVEGEEGSLVSLSTVGDSTAGSIIIPSRGVVYEVRPAGDGEVYFSEVNTAEMGECYHCREVPQPPQVSFNQD